MIKKRQAFILIFLSILSLSFDIAAQINIGPEQTFYDKLMASNSKQKQVDFNLKGNIKSLIEISSANDDSTLFHFNLNGLLVKRFTSSTQELTLYSFEKDQLRSIHFEDPHSKYFSKKHFNSLGYIEKEVTERINYSDTFHQESNYFFNEKYDELNIYYKYNIDTARWDVVLNDFYVFTFNNKNQVTKEKNLSKYPETTYGNTTTYYYDSLSGNLIYVRYIDDCAMTASSNSCGNFETRISYDNHNNIIAKSLSDHTIRNSNWTSSYSYSAKYNENNDIIEEYYSNSEDREKYLRELFVKEKDKTNDVVKKTTPVFEYEYDLKGNWIKKYEGINNTRKLIKRRIIEYYN
jgi:hypothetical protein